MIDDELAEERLAELTETGAALDEEGADSLDPGNQDVSERLRRNQPNEDAIPSSTAVLEGNVEDIKDEAKSDDEAGA